MKFRHECPEWDYMVIDETDREFLACVCFDDPAAIKAREYQQREQELSNSTQKCKSCGGQMPWCSTCRCYTQSCCVDYGTCQCS